MSAFGDYKQTSLVHPLFRSDLAKRKDIENEQLLC